MKYNNPDYMEEPSNPFSSLTPGMKVVQEKVTAATTPLASLPYIDQVGKKMKETRWMAQQLAADLVQAHPQCKSWVDKNVQQLGYLAKVEKCVESPVKEGYRNKCEFAIGLNPETRRLTVGFKLDPRSGSSDVGPVDHLLHVPASMKHVVKLLEAFLRTQQPYQHYDMQRCEGQWVNAVVRTTRAANHGKAQIMVLLTFCSHHMPTAEVMNVKTQVRGFFERGDGSQCGVTSVFFAEKSMQGVGTPELLLGEATVAETLQGNLKFHISPRAYFCINTAGAEVLVGAIANLAGLHRDMTILDLCCGTGALGLCLASRVGQVLGVDILGTAVEEAERNALVNRLGHCSYITGNVEDTIPRMVQAAKHEEVVAIVDPPRAGLSEKAIQQLRSSRVQKLIFVSSDPKATIRNFVDLGRATSGSFHGDPFLPTVIQPVDLFPHTTHFMTVLLMLRTSLAPSNPFSPSPSASSSSLFPAYNKPGSSEADLTETQATWLKQMVAQHGPAFTRDEWVAKFRADNAKARPAAAAPAPLPLSRPPSPEIPPMPPFPVAPTSKDPREYAKYKAEYDAYSTWYTKWGEAYAAKEEKKKSKAKGRELPDPTKVPAGTDPVAWRKYCQDTVEYWQKYDRAHQ